MHIGKSYKLTEFVLWTRRSLFWLLIYGTIPTVMYQVLNLKWLTIPWSVVALLGTATAFMVGFKNVQTYNRTWEARQIWGASISASRAWAMMCRDYVDDPVRGRNLINRHIAWLTALRYQLRSGRPWETMSNWYNKEYTKFYTIPEWETPQEEELGKYIVSGDIEKIKRANNKAFQLLSMQGSELKALHSDGVLDNYRFMAMHEALRDFSNHQGRSERIKNFPYPRQYATVNAILINLFCIMLPFALLGEFNNMNQNVSGRLSGSLVWLVIPFSMLISWIYTSLEQVGESTANPFEGSANDVPISQMSRAVEIDIREMLGEVDLPPVIAAKNEIVI